MPQVEVIEYENQIEVNNASELFREVAKKFLLPSGGYSREMDATVILHQIGERYSPYHEENNGGVFGEYYISKFTVFDGKYVIIPPGKIECYLQNAFTKMYRGEEYFSFFKYAEKEIVIFGKNSTGIQLKYDGKHYNTYPQEMVVTMLHLLLN